MKLAFFVLFHAKFPESNTHLIMGKALRLEEQHSLAHMAVAVSEETVWELFLTLGSYAAKYKDTVISNSKS